MDQHMTMQISLYAFYCILMINTAKHKWYHLFNKQLFLIRDALKAHSEPVTEQHFNV
jgi:hypothetical protein